MMPMFHNATIVDGNVSVISYEKIGFAVHDFIPVAIRHYHHVNEQLVCYLSLLLNATLMGLLVTEHNEVLRAYTRVLLQNCVIDVLYTLTIFVTEMQMEFIDGQLIMLFNGFFKELPATPFHFFFAGLWTQMCSFSIMIIPIIFYFRYVLVVKDRLMNRIELVILLSIPLVTSIIEAIVIVLAMRSNDNAERPEKCAALLVHPIFHQKPEDEVQIQKCIFARADSGYLIFYLLFALLMDGSMYVTMCYCTLRVMSTMHDATHQVSERTAKLQRQMNVLLIIQMILPVFSAVLPVISMIAGPLLRISVPGLGILVSMLFAWVPLTSPLSTIMLVANFRQRLYRLLVLKPLSRLDRYFGGATRSNVLSSVSKVDTTPAERKKDTSSDEVDRRVQMMI